MDFKLTAPYQPTGDQPQAIRALSEGILQGEKAQTLLGVTGSGKTFTMANVIQQVNRPTLVMSHNKTLAAQLYAEFSAFFPNNAVEYFVSYYDYYQPEAYMPSSGVYIEKALKINETIEKMRLSTVSSLLSGRRDVIVVASVSCIYGLSNPAEFGKNVFHISVGDTMDRDSFLLELINLLYSRNEESFGPASFRVRGDTVDVFLAYGDIVYRFYFFDNEIEAIQEIDPEEGKTLQTLSTVSIYPANLFVTSKSMIEEATEKIEAELRQQVAFFNKNGKTEEAERLEERTRLDITMMREIGHCAGIENYSRFFDRRQAGQRPYCLLDYFPDDYLLLIDESHVSIRQVKGMSGGDRARKRLLIDYGFRIPAAADNRPLTLEEFETLTNQVVYVSATPAPYELTASQGLIVEQLIRPTGLLDPLIEVVPTEHQIDHLIEQIRLRLLRNERVLVTTLTKKMAEELSKFFKKASIPCEYLHSEIKTLERIQILEGLKKGDFGVLVGVNLLREGLDLPEASLLAILDADKEGFLRNTPSLIQMIGRVARHVDGKVYMYADKVSPSMKAAIDETARRREKQMAYNQLHGITPKPVGQAQQTTTRQKKAFTEDLYVSSQEAVTYALGEKVNQEYGGEATLKKLIKKKEKDMQEASKNMDYLKAQRLKDEIATLRKKLADPTTS